MTSRKLKSHTFKCNKIEKKVFIRWINNRLKSTKHIITDIRRDLLDGLMLIPLVETLLGRPITDVHCVDTEPSSTDIVNAALLALCNEGVILTDINSSTIIEGQLNSIMEFIWRLISHFSIFKPLAMEKRLLVNNPEDFLKWINMKMPGQILTNFCSDWSSGISLGVLVNTCDRDLCIDAKTWDVNNKLKNVRFAMEAAFQCLNVLQILRPSEIITEQASERAVITYLSQFIERLMQISTEDDDVIEEIDPSFEEEDCNTSMMLAAISIDQQRVEESQGCHVRILEEGRSHVVNQPIHIFVKMDYTEDMVNSDLVMEIKGPNNYIDTPPGKIAVNGSEIEFTFTHSLPGLYDVMLCKTISGSTATILKRLQITLLDEKVSDNLIVYGPGLYEAVTGHYGVFILESNNADKQIGFSMEGPSKVEIECLDLGNGTIKFTYMVGKPGQYELSISLNEVAIVDSPYRIEISSPTEIRNYSNIQVTEIVNANTASLFIDTRQTNIEVAPDITCFDEYGHSLKCVEIEEEAKQVFTCLLTFTDCGRYVIFACFHNIQILGFPRIIFISTMSPHAESSNLVEERSILSLQNKCMAILTDEMVDAIEVSVRLFCATICDLSESNLESNTCDGASTISKIVLDDRESEHLVDELYKWTDQTFGLSLLGSSLNGCPIRCYQSHQIVIDLNSSTCLGELGLSIEGPSNTNVQCRDDNNGRCIITYKPTKPGQYEFIVTFNDEPIEGSPFIILVCDNSKSSCHSISPKFQTEDNSQNQCTFSSITGKSQKNVDKLEDMSLTSIMEENWDNVASVYHSNVSQISEPHLQISSSNSSRNISFNGDFDECKSTSSSISSEESSHSIKSGVYVAKIKRVVTLDLPRTRRKSTSPHSPDDELDSSNEYNCNLEIDRISLNYKESLNSFYGNMLSAFTNLLVMETMFTSVDNLSDEIISEISKGSPNCSIKCQDIPVISSLEEESHICLESDLSITLTDSTTIQDTISIHSQYESNATSVANPGGHLNLDSSSNTTSTIVLRDNLRGCIKRMAYQSQCVDDQSSIHRSYIVPRKVADDSEVTVTLMGCRKSIRVDLGSSSLSTNNIPAKKRTIKTSAEIIFNSLSQTISKKVSELISVYKNPFIPYLNCSKECSTSYDTVDKMSSSIVSEAISSGIDSTSTYLDKYLKNHIKRSRRLIAGSGERGDENLAAIISCHASRPPLSIPRLRNHREGRWKRHVLRLKRLRVSNYSATAIRCVTEVTHNSFHANAAIQQICMQSRPLSVQCIQFDEEEAYSFVDKVNEEHQVDSSTEYFPEQNVVKISFANSRFQKIRFKHHPLYNNKDCQTNFTLMESVNLDDLILSDILHGLILMVAIDQLVKLHRKNVNPTKEGTAVQLLDREAQTCVDTNMFISTTDISSASACRAEGTNRYNNGALDEIPVNDTNTNDVCPQKDRGQKIASVAESSASDIKDISLAVETLVDAITDIAKTHIINRPSKRNIKRVEELIGLLPKLIMFGKEKKLHEINYLTDDLESILLHNDKKGRDNNALNLIIRSIKKCLQMDYDPMRCDVKDCHDLNKQQETINDTGVINDYGNAEDNTSDLFVMGEVNAVGQALERGFVNHDNKFVVYTKCAIPGSLSICIEGPSKAKINFVDKKIGIYIVCYRVSIAGEYYCSITYNLNNINNSPFKIAVTPYRSRNKSTVPSAPYQIDDGSQVIMLPVNRNVIFHLRNESMVTLTCFVTGPSGICGYLPIESTKDCDGIIRLFTSHVGVYNLDFFNSFGEKVGQSRTLNVTNMRRGLSSNTVHCNVDIRDDEGALKGAAEEDAKPNILAYGEGLSSGQVHCKNTFYLIIKHGYDDNVDEVLTKDPSLNVTIDGPSKVELSCTDDSVGYTFWYIATVSGLYYISISYSDNHHIPGSPFKVHISS